MLKPPSRRAWIAGAVLALLLPVPGRALPKDVSTHALLSLPMGEFADEHRAAPGFGAGMEISAHLHPRFALTAGGGLSLNDMEDSAGMGAETDPGTWVQLPAFAGFRVLGESEVARGYVQIHAGFSLGTRTDARHGPETRTMDWELEPGFGFGAGFMVKTIHVGIRFYRMAEAEHEIESDWTFSDSDAEPTREDVNTTLLYILLGVNFGP